ncbi:MAG: hypothetical protein D6776_08140 [Planctomycetota bacterium]|nr:MAG: hypothetical protein D6776_08140 [Planctomycetota bacterium]
MADRTRVETAGSGPLGRRPSRSADALRRAQRARFAAMSGRERLAWMLRLRRLALRLGASSRGRAL